MKNIHLIPTDKARLYIHQGKLYDNKKTMHIPDGTQIPQHIYITSDEEINQQTKPCFCINTIKNTWNADLIYYQDSMPQYHYKGFKNIILTTDQDLINDGVQAIDDTFLEWFVKNPNCEEVKVTRNLADEGIKGITYYGKYFIIIPQEESIQETIEEADYNKIIEQSLVELRKQPISFVPDKIMYSEEEVIEILHSRMRYTLSEDYKEMTTIEWFEKLKKK